MKKLSIRYNKLIILGMAVLLFSLTIFGRIIVDSEIIQADGILPDSAIIIDVNTEELKVTTAQDSIIYISDQKKKVWEEIQVENGVAICDISWITKDYELNIKGDVSTGIVTKKIPAPRALKASLTIKDGKPVIEFTIDKKPFGDINTIQWRKGTKGAWRNYSELNINSFLVKGATINFRALPGIVSGSAVQASKIASLKIPKRSNAPSTTVDGTKMNIAFKKNTEYMLTINNNKSGWIPIDQTLKLSQLPGITGDGIINPLSAFTLKVRTKANGKKMESKIRTMAIPAQKKLDAGPDFTVAISARGVTLSNQSNLEYQYIVQDGKVDSADKITDKTKWSTVKAGKSVEISSKKITSASFITYRIAPVKDNKKTPEVDETAIASTVVSVQAPMVPVS